MTERQIQVAVARADLFVTAALRVVLIVGILTVVLLLAVLIVRHARGHPDRPPPEPSPSGEGGFCPRHKCRGQKTDEVVHSSSLYDTERSRSQ